MAETVKDIWQRALGDFQDAQAKVDKDNLPHAEPEEDKGDPWLLEEVTVEDNSPTHWYPFSQVFGFEPPSGNDRLGPVYGDSEDFPEYLRKFIPEVDQDYEMPKEETEALWHAHIDNDLVWLHGASGTGKSSLEEQFAARIGQPFLRFNGREDVDSSALFGQMVVEGEETVWKDGLLTEGVKHGARVLLDEATAIPAGIFMGLQWLAEKDGKLMLTDKPGHAEDRLVTPDPRFRLSFADNTRGQGDESGNHTGTGVINTALLNRIGTTIEIGYLPRSQEIALLSRKFGDRYKPELFEAVRDVAEQLRKAQAKGEISLAFSLRSINSMLTKFWHLKSERHWRSTAALRHAFDLAYANLLPTDEEQGAARNMFSMVFEK